MHRFWFPLLALGLVACVPEQQTSTVAPKEAEQAKTIFQTMQVEGRALMTEDGLRMSFPGTRLRVKPCFGSYKLTFKAVNPNPLTGFDRISKHDRVPLPLMFHDGEFTEISVTINHPSSGEEFELLRRNESWQGDVILVNGESTQGFCEPTPLPKTKLLFIGDSITAGAGTTSRVNDEGEREAVSNARLAYPRVLGDRLNAQVHQVAYGGRGLVRDWQGITDTNNAPQFYDRVLPDNPDHLWDPADYQADIVSVMLGTNDFNPGIPDRESWTQTYKDFVSRIRADYPKAQIFLISSPMTGGEKGDALKAYVREVAESFDTPGVQYLQVSQYYGEAWDSHPTAAEHEMMADELEPAFRAVLE